MSVSFRPDAVVELNALLAGIRSRNPTAADKVQDQIARTLALLERHPLSRPRLRLRPPNPRLRGLRYANVRRYPQFLILYLPTAAGVEVLHVARGRRNLGRLVARD